MSSTANPATCRSGRRTTRARIGRRRTITSAPSGRLFRDVEFALPKELSERQQVALAREFSASVTTGTGERLPYTLAVHHWRGGEPPRASDVLRAGERTASRAAPSSGFAGTTPRLRTRAGPRNPRRRSRRRGLSRPRASWAEQANRALARAGWPGADSRREPGAAAHRGRAPRRRQRDRTPGASGAGGASRSTQPRAGRARGVVGGGWPRSARSRTATQALASGAHGRVPHGAGPAPRAG